MYLAERVRGGLVGLLVGDALGVPYEFHPAEALPPLEQLEMEPPPGFARAHAGVPPGTWSDDGAQALALLASLLAQGRLNLADFAQRLLAWRMRGYMAVDSRVFDVGVQTHRALEALARGVPPAEAGPAEERANGNGSLMRVLPLAMWHQGSDEALVQDAMLQSNPTHRHPRARVCCALYCLWARYELLGLAQAWEKAVSTLEALLPEASAERSELDRHVRPRDNPRCRAAATWWTPCTRPAGRWSKALASSRWCGWPSRWETIPTPPPAWPGASLASATATAPSRPAGGRACGARPSTRGCWSSCCRPQPESNRQPHRPALTAASHKIPYNPTRTVSE
ncbi:MAG: ADP-ribosylglycohydrolase family protein [Meiothermus sp.]|nr:ADP-ribosylglycohydrolase family protein [Meiothermus sp.]MCS7069216.1 ADP-ribosylglycohydrolase family protein [Meiothermus sp.]MDW8425782.1 ADP-ribosylglycohydrolase family protein [Meiothermus sp.]